MLVDFLVKRLIPQPVTKLQEVIYRPTTPRQVVERGFGSVEYGRAAITALQKCMEDPNGLIFLYGSLVTNTCENPRQTWFKAPPDLGRESDVDLGFIDGYYFNRLSPSDIIRKPELIGPELAGKVSYPLIDSNGKPKSVLMKATFGQLKQVLQEIMDCTGRIVDINIYPGKQVLKAGRIHSGIVLADSRRLYF